MLLLDLDIKYIMFNWLQKDIYLRFIAVMRRCELSKSIGKKMMYGVKLIKGKEKKERIASTTK